MIILIFVVFFTLLVSGLCSLFEAVLYSTRTGTLEAVGTEEKKQALAHRFLAMKREIAVPIAAILILNTIANTAGATLAGMYATKVLGTSWVLLFSFAFTLGILLLSEILPKTVGAIHWRKLWPFIVWPLTAMEYALYPLIQITQKMSNLVTRGHTVSTITEEEILAIVRLGAQEGEISHQESRMIRNIIDLENKRCWEIMTPRTVMFTLDAHMTIAEAHPIVNAKEFSRIPLYEEDRENIIGYVMKHDLNSIQALEQPQMQLKSLAKPIAFVPETINCLTLLTTFLRQRSHIAIVLDEYGGVAGVVTLEDLIETILGTEIVDETDRVVDLQESARKRQIRHE